MNVTQQNDTKTDPSNKRDAFVVNELDKQKSSDKKDKKFSTLIIGVVFVAIVTLVAILIIQSGSFGLARPGLVKVVVSVPINLDVGNNIVNAVTLAFEEANYMAGNTKVELLILDDGDEDGRWQEEFEERNALVAADDESVVAYIGALSSGASKISMPILNRAGIVQISPGNTWPGLTKEGFIPGEPGKFYPTGVRHYVRVVTTDDFQGPAAALWAQELGFKSVYIVDDGDSYGKGIADLFSAYAEDIDIVILKHITIDKLGTDFTKEVEEIKQFNPDLVYFGGATPNGLTYFFSQMRDIGVESAFMGPDGVIGSNFISQVGSDRAEGVFATTIGALAFDIGTSEAAHFSREYEKRFGTEPKTFGIFGYESAKVVLLGIEQAQQKTRDSILQKVRQTTDFEGILGKWSFNTAGDTTFGLMSGYVVKDGVFEFVKVLQYIDN